ncbi:MAG: AbrB/MazE/SpoVT family DNA-binding domain-containing protein [Desulfamplus sp.]|nr:AbrB/MazE/SpoVT family DNA-binding domain-containing protein [Desulfamplus sp.]
MRINVIKIGNSQGVFIPRPFLDQIGIKDDVEIEVDKNRIIITPIFDSVPRAGWENEFKAMAKKFDDKLIIGKDIVSHSWDNEEWEW